MHEQNWERVKSTLLSEGAAIRGELRSEFRVGLAEVRADLLKWMFVYWTGTVVTIGGLIVGLRIFGPR